MTSESVGRLNEMKNGYWSSVLNRRVQRRRALTLSGAGLASAAFLAACGGGDSGGGSGDGDSSGMVTKPVDTTKEAKRGGTIKDYIRGEPATMDPFNPNAALNAASRSVHGMLLREKPGHLKIADGTIEGDLAESWEFSPDGMQITMKLRQGVKWHNKPPVNARTVDVQDVLFSWTRYEDKAPLASILANKKSPDAPVLSMTAPDARTLVIKLKEPVVYVANYFGGFGSFTGQVMLDPKETDTTLDIRNDMVGHGPFQLAAHTPSVGFTLKRNPDYWDKDWALADQIDLPVVTEPATQLSQFKAGNIHYFEGMLA